MKKSLKNTFVFLLYTSLVNSINTLENEGFDVFNVYE